MASKRRKAAAAADEKLRVKTPAKRISRRKAPDGESPKGKAEEIDSYKTPKRSSRPCLPTFSSPANETDIQQEIFWDHHSPIAHKLDPGRKKQPTGRSTVEISEIVNRIAPQEEKPSCYEESLLGMWIGDDAIPCTPGIAKVRSRTKVNNTRGLQQKNKEEELMELAKQFDKNLTEAIQKQDAPCHNATHLLPEAKVFVKCQGDAHIENSQHVLGDHPQIDAALPLGAVKENAECCEHNSRKPIDLDAEVALNALFDCSPQKCSGRLSQGSSSSSFHSSQNAVLVEEHISEETAGGSHGSVAADAPQRHGSAPASKCRGLTTAKKTKMVFEQPVQSAVIFKTEPQNAVISKTELAVSSNTVSNDLEDWDADLLLDDSFVMQITQNPELIRTPQNASPSAFQESCKTKERTINSDRPNRGRCTSPKSSNNVATLKLQKQSHELGGTKSVPPQSHFPFKNNLVNSISNPVSSISKSGQIRISGCTSISVKLENKCVTERFTQLKSTSVLEKEATSLSVHPNLPKPLSGKSRSNVFSIHSKSSSIFPNSKPNDQQELASHASSNHLQAGLPKKHASSFGDWNEPRLSDDVLDLFCESDGLWGLDREDDDLLYRVCDDVEKNTLSQDVAKGSVKAASVVTSAAKLEMNPGLLVLKQGLANCPLPQKIRKTFSLNAALTPAVPLKNENSADPYGQLSCVSLNSTQGKLHRPNFVPDRSLPSRCGLVPMSNTCLNTTSSTQWQNVTCNVGKVQNISSSNQEKSKYAFRKTSSSQALILDHNSGTRGSRSGAPLALGESKNGPNIPLHTALQINPKTTLKRHLSDSFANLETERMSRKCSQEEIAKKKQEALERRKYKMQALLKNTAPT
ncbi:ewing's tumor-associated antigen 1 [Heteronotia binoei]|uniref:ewing's tumor-associated antigen 1 n=1 Tax=Heteronotia binoei TaxID=13085 RepID=UPI002930874A|nr:ewing's tumor-associated antigen 1 [Heteronotia binoei]